MSKSVVIDASFVFKLIMPGPQQTHLRGLITQWQQHEYVLCAPTLWLYEITSTLCKLIHFGELTLTEGRRMLALVYKLGIQLIPPDDVQTQSAFDWTIRLQRAAAYDSFYLALAETLDCELWTADKRLHHAVELSWVHCVI
jgi:predicted nucleic acid-binding protein